MPIRCAWDRAGRAPWRPGARGTDAVAPGRGLAGRGARPGGSGVGAVSHMYSYGYVVPCRGGVRAHSDHDRNLPSIDLHYSTLVYGR